MSLNQVLYVSKMVCYRKHDYY